MERATEGASVCCRGPAQRHGKRSEREGALGAGWRLDCTSVTFRGLPRRAPAAHCWLWASSRSRPGRGPGTGMEGPRSAGGAREGPESRALRSNCWRALAAQAAGTARQLRGHGCPFSPPSRMSVGQAFSGAVGTPAEPVAFLGELHVLPLAVEALTACHPLW